MEQEKSVTIKEKIRKFCSVKFITVMIILANATALVYTNHMKADIWADLAKMILLWYVIGNAAAKFAMKNDGSK